MKNALTFRDRVVLMRIEDQHGHGSGQVIRSSQAVSCHVGQPSLTRQLSGEVSGMSADLFIHLWRRDIEADSYNYVEHKGIRYRIDKQAPGVNDLFVWITVTKGA